LTWASISIFVATSPPSLVEKPSQPVELLILARGGCVAQTWSHAFEAAFIAQTVVRPVTTLQNGFKMVGRLGHMGKEGNDGDAWLNSIDSTRATRQLDNTTPKTNQRVPAPGSNTTSAIPTRAPKTTLINPATAGLQKGKTMTVRDDRTTKRL
jgi:hypothetical protein